MNGGVGALPVCGRDPCEAEEVDDNDDDEEVVTEGWERGPLARARASRSFISFSNLLSLRR